MNLFDLATPALVLDRRRLAANCRRMAEKARALGVDLRPHLKTAKSAEVARLATSGFSGGITVSTLAEAEYFAARGFRDLTYAVGLAPGKIGRVDSLQRGGATVHVLVDNLAAAAALAAAAPSLARPLHVMIEIDTGGGRAGLPAEADEIVAIGRLVSATAKLALRGVLTHAGQSYKAKGPAIRAVAESERAGAVRAAERLRAAGLACPVVSVGATPTAIWAERLDGVTEMRPGVYTLMDLYQMAIDVCRADDIACSVLATVIGHNPRTGRILIDAGGLALSQDKSAAGVLADTGYGWVAEAESGRPIPGLYVAETNQEHGMIAAAYGAPPFARLPVGARVRVLPNHVCMMAAPYDRYHVVEGGAEIVAEWGKARGW